MSLLVVALLALPPSELVEEEGAVSALVLAALGALYKSEYQPPPLRMKPPPREIWRFARAAPHSGQSLSGASEMDCWASQRCPHASHRYS